MRRRRRYLEAVARLQGASWLPLDGELEAALQNIGGLDSWVRMSRDVHASLYFRLDKQRHVPGSGTLRLRQDLARDARRGGRRRTLRRCSGGHELGEPAKRAAGNTCKASPREHDDPPARCVEQARYARPFLPATPRRHQPSAQSISTGSAGSSRDNACALLTARRAASALYSPSLSGLPGAVFTILARASPVFTLTMLMVSPCLS